MGPLKRFSCSLHGLYSAVEDYDFLPSKTTDTKFQEVIFVSSSGSSNWQQGRLRWDWSTCKFLLGICWLHSWLHLTKGPQVPWKGSSESATASFWRETCSNQTHALSDELVTLQNPKRGSSPPVNSDSLPNLKKLFACMTLLCCIETSNKLKLNVGFICVGMKAQTL